MRSRQAYRLLPCGSFGFETALDFGRINPPNLASLGIDTCSRLHRHLWCHQLGVCMWLMLVLLNATVWANIPAKIDQTSTVVAAFANLGVAVRANLPFVANKVVAVGA